MHNRHTLASAKVPAYLALNAAELQNSANGWRVFSFNGFIIRPTCRILRPSFGQETSCLDECFQHLLEVWITTSALFMWLENEWQNEATECEAKCLSCKCCAKSCFCRTLLSPSIFEHGVSMLRSECDCTVGRHRVSNLPAQDPRHAKEQCGGPGTFEDMPDVPSASWLYCLFSKCVLYQHARDSDVSAWIPDRLRCATARGFLSCCNCVYTSLRHAVPQNTDPANSTTSSDAALLLRSGTDQSAGPSCSRDVREV